MDVRQMKTANNRIRTVEKNVKINSELILVKILRPESIQKFKNQF